MVIGPVRISVSNEFRLPHSVHDAMVGASSKISHDMFDSIYVVWTECGSEWGERPDGSTYVGVSSHGGIS